MWGAVVIMWGAFVILQELQQNCQHDWQSVIYGLDIFQKAVEIVQRNRITGDLNRRPMGFNRHLSYRDLILTSCPKGSYLHSNRLDYHR